MRNVFELKKNMIAMVLGCFIFLNQGFSAQISQGLFQDGVDAYKKGDAQECLNIMKVLEKKDSSNAYVIYYLAMSNTKLGNFDEAIKNYEKVISLNQDIQLTAYAREGIGNIEAVTGKSDKKAKNKYNPDKPPSSKVSKGTVPEVSDDEVAKAIKTLRQAGLLNVNLGVSSTPVSADNGMNDFLKQNSDLMNLNMMMGTMSGSKGSSGMDMLPLLMMQQGASGGQSKISPEVIQMMMNNAMLDGMSAFDTSKDK